MEKTLFRADTGDSMQDSGVSVSGCDSNEPLSSAASCNNQLIDTGGNPKSFTVKEGNTRLASTLKYPSIDEESSTFGMASHEATKFLGRNLHNLKLFPMKKTYTVMYMGMSSLDRRYTQTIMPWVMAEVKRKQEFSEISLEVLTTSLRGTSKAQESGSKVVLFDHRLQNLTRFARLKHNPCCFGYLMRHHIRHNFECHVFLALEESKVPEIFEAIREATREVTRDAPNNIDDIEDNLRISEPDNAQAFYEVLYVGKSKTSGKKISSHDIDTLVDEMMVPCQLLGDDIGEQRKRNASGASIKSLPGTLDSVSVTENLLVRQVLSLGGSSDSSTNDLISIEPAGGSSDHLMEDGERGTDNTPWDSISKDSVLSDSRSSPRSVLFNPHDKVNVYEDNGLSREEINRTMLFRLSVNDVALISPDTKCAILVSRFKDISFVSQGHYKKDVFGFIARESGNVFICHLLRCHSTLVVDEIMTALRVAFKCAYEQTRQTKTICTMCPLHQFHKVSQSIEGLSPEHAYENVYKHVLRLPEADRTEVLTQFKIENPQFHEEMLDVLMIGLRKICELRQKEHTHISDGMKAAKGEFYILDIKGHAATKFDNFKGKAKKTLANSFETLLRGRKKDEARDAFRQRSGTTDSDSSLAGRSLASSVTSSPDCSPAISPITKDFRPHFPSPPHSPRLDQRPRSQTVGAIPDHAAFLSSRKLSFPDKEEAEMKSPKPVNSSHSPMRHMFLIAGSGQPAAPQRSESVDAVSPFITPTKGHSWRQAIFNRVVTPMTPAQISRVKEKSTEPEFESPDEEAQHRSHKYRSKWKKAILETLFLIRMEKENQSFKARQDESETRRQKLDYREITPGNLGDVLSTWETILDQNCSELDKDTIGAAVKKGVSRMKRGHVWRLLMKHHGVRGCVSSQDSGMGGVSPDEDFVYEELLKQLTTHQHAILIDLGRTFPGHPYFSTQLGPGQLALFNLLKAYSLLDQEVGYCQGLSFVAGVLLMHMDESQAFESMKFLMFELGLRQQYRPDMTSLQVNLYQLTRLIHDNHKDLYDHFESLEIVPTLYAAPWFLTLFASQFPLGFVARVIDLVFLQGIDVIFKVALMLLGNHKELIKQHDSFESVMEFLKTTLPEMGIIQMERIINQIFDLDLTQQLQAYEVEYHVLQEEMLTSPQRSDNDIIHKLELANRNLKRQNMELLEKLQTANSQNHTLEIALDNCKSNEMKIKSQIQVLEMERTALLENVARLRRHVPSEISVEIDRTLPDAVENMNIYNANSVWVTRCREESSTTKGGNPLTQCREESSTTKGDNPGKMSQNSAEMRGDRTSVREGSDLHHNTQH